MVIVNNTLSQPLYSAVIEFCIEVVSNCLVLGGAETSLEQAKHNRKYSRLTPESPRGPQQTNAKTPLAIVSVPRWHGHDTTRYYSIVSIESLSTFNCYRVGQRSIVPRM